MPDRTATSRARTGDDGTAKTTLVGRVQAKITDASQEHRDNAGASPEKGRRTKVMGRTPRRARLRLVRIDPWSVMKTAFLLSVAFGVVTFVAVFMIWSVLGAAGVWEAINSTVASVVAGDAGTSTFDVTNYVGMSRVLGFTLLVSVIDVILLTAIATLGAFLYNMAAALLGGVEMTLAEDDQ